MTRTSQKNFKSEIKSCTVLLLGGMRAHITQEDRRTDTTLPSPQRIEVAASACIKVMAARTGDRLYVIVA